MSVLSFGNQRHRTGDRGSVWTEDKTKIKSRGVPAGSVLLRSHHLPGRWRRFRIWGENCKKILVQIVKYRNLFCDWWVRLSIIVCSKVTIRKKAPLQRLNIDQHSFEIIIINLKGYVCICLTVYSLLCGKFRIFVVLNWDLFCRSCFLGVLIFPLSSLMMGSLDCRQVSYADIVWYEFALLRRRAFVSRRLLLRRILSRFCCGFHCCH